MRRSPTSPAQGPSGSDAPRDLDGVAPAKPDGDAGSSEEAAGSDGTTRRVVLVGLLTALAVALKQALAAIPNVELVSLTLFIAGWLLGRSQGLLVGALAAIAGSLSSPLGVGSPLLVATLAAAYGLVGWLGGMRHRARSTPPGPAEAGLLGLVATAGFQALVNAQFVFLSGTPPWVVLASAAPYIAAHVVSNTLLFALLLPVLLQRIEPLRRRLLGPR